MEFLGIDEFMLYLKTKFDESERKQDWRALTGRNHVTREHDTFIFTDRRVFQIKASEIAPQRMAAVAGEIGGPAPDMLELIKGGSTIPLNVTSTSTDMRSVIMFGMQQYSSDVADMFRREYYSCRQEALARELDRRVRVFAERPEFRASRRSLVEDQEGYFA